MRPLHPSLLALCALTTVACTALLGDFEVGPGGNASSSSGGDEGGAGAVSVTPAETKLGILRSVTFTATGEVTWSVQEGAAGGAVDGAGKYISPDKAGVYHVVATSKADASKSASATVTVAPLGMNHLTGEPAFAGNQDAPPDKTRLSSPEGAGMLRVSGGEQVIIVADTGNQIIRKLQNNVVSTIAGKMREAGFVDGVGAAARFDRPTAVVTDDNGKRVWVLDANNYCIRKIDIDTGGVTTFAGKCGTSGHVDSTDNTGATALFERLDAMILGPYKNALYVCEIDNFRGIRRIDATTGKVTTVMSGLNNGCTMAADYFGQGAGQTNGRIYFNDNNNEQATKYIIDPGTPFTNPVVNAGITGMPDGYWSGLAVDTGYGGSLGLVALSNREPVMYKAAVDDGATAFEATPFIGVPAMPGLVDGPYTTARLERPSSINAYSPNGMYVITDGNTVRTIRNGSNGDVRTILGVTTKPARVDGPKVMARTTGPIAAAVDENGVSYIVDVGLEIENNTIRRFDPTAGTLTTFSGKPTRPQTTVIPTDGPADQAIFALPWDIVRAGNDLFVLDVFAHAVRRVSMANGAVTTIAGELKVPGNSEGIGAAAHFKFFDPIAGDDAGFAVGIATDGANLYVSDGGNYAIRKIVIATGEVSTIAGGTKGTANGVGNAAQFLSPQGLAYADGALYVADTGDHTIRKIDLASKTVSSFMGLTGTAGVVDGDAATATFTRPFRLVADGLGNLYVTEAPFQNQNGGVIRRIEIANKRVSNFIGERGKQAFKTGPLPGLAVCPGGMAVQKNFDLVYTDFCEQVLVKVSSL